MQLQINRTLMVVCNKDKHDKIHNCVFNLLIYYMLRYNILLRKLQ